MILKGEKVTLRPMVESDASIIVKCVNDPEVQKFTSRRTKKLTLKNIKKWIIKDLAKDKDFKKFAINLKGIGYIGNTGLYVTKQDNYAEFDIVIHRKEFWGKGYGTDAAKTILKYGFEKLKLHMVYLHTYEYNKRALSLYKKLGFKVDGVMRESVLYKGKYHDKIIMGMLAKEWKNKQKS